jgi:hypothetical protein
VALVHGAVGFLRVGEPALPEGDLGVPHLELRQEVIHRQETLHAVALDAFRIDEQQRRSPLRAEAIECLRLILDVDLDGDVTGVDGLPDLRIGVDLGIQPSASPSHGGRVEVHQEGLLRGLCLRECRVDVLEPLDVCHGVFLVKVDGMTPSWPAGGEMSMLRRPA